MHCILCTPRQSVKLHVYIQEEEEEEGEGEEDEKNEEKDGCPFRRCRVTSRKRRRRMLQCDKR